LLQRAPQCGITTVLAICFESNARSCNLFAKLGFER
jgi:L-amino acid N-acyltransferase YncA